MMNSRQGLPRWGLPAIAACLECANKRHRACIRSNEKAAQEPMKGESGVHSLGTARRIGSEHELCSLIENKPLSATI